MFPIEKMCQVLNVSRSGYYSWRKRHTSACQEREERTLGHAIKQAYQTSKRTYGSPRIAIELQQKGWTVSRATIGRRMKDLQLRSMVSRKFVATTQSNHGLPIAENLLARNFGVQRLAQVWVSDITYVRIGPRWGYLTAIIDLADRSVIGWSLSKEMDVFSTVIRAWKKAVQRRKISGPLIFHSDRGVQYASLAFRKVLSDYPNVSQSMSRKGNCWDNAVAESFFKTLKCEWLYYHTYRSFEEADSSIFEYIECWYNSRRKHSTLGYQSPAQIEKHFLTNMANLP
jgi:transposase InsO family protein